MSPYADLTLSGETILEKQAVDPILTPDGLRLRVPAYVAGADASDPHISPAFGDLSRLPPLLIQVGSHEILLSDAPLAARAATADVQIALEVTPGCPHVFQGFAAVLDEGDAALDRASAFLRTQYVATQPTRLLDLRADTYDAVEVKPRRPAVLPRPRGRRPSHRPPSARRAELTRR